MFGSKNKLCEPIYRALLDPSLFSYEITEILLANCLFNVTTPFIECNFKGAYDTIVFLFQEIINYLLIIIMYIIVN